MKDEIIHKIKGYLGHKVPVITPYFKTNLDSINLVTFLENGTEFKLILRPVEDLTDEEYKNIVGWESNLRDLTKEELIYTIKYAEITDEFSYGLIKYFQERHLDYQDLIGQELAIKKEKE
jgi:hypothetical protein